MSLLTDGEQLHRGWQPAPKARNPKPGLNDLTSCRLLDSHVLFYDCEGIPCKLRLFFYPAKHQSSACTLCFIKLICFSKVTDDSEEWACEDETLSPSNESQ